MEDEKMCTETEAVAADTSASDVYYQCLTATVRWEPYFEYREWGLRGVFIRILRVQCRGERIFFVSEDDPYEVAEPWSIDVDENTGGWSLAVTPITTRWGENLAPRLVDVDLAARKIVIEF